VAVNLDPKSQQNHGQDPEWFLGTGRPSKIVCVGKNWEAHAKELGSQVPEAPLLFLKPPSALTGDGTSIRLPAGAGRVDHEVELGVVIGKRLRNVQEADALEGVRGWCLALDVTARDQQSKAKKAGHPWTMAKGHDTFCPVSPVLGKDEVDPADARLVLSVNGELRQDGTTKDMVWSVPALLAYISRIMTLEPGDLVLTGTPQGVGPLAPADTLEGSLNGQTLLRIRVEGKTDD
jgi:acylpyruvate hydrolase